MFANLIAAKRKCCNIETPQTYKKKIDPGSMWEDHAQDSFQFEIVYIVPLTWNHVSLIC